jgi:putative transposase
MREDNPLCVRKRRFVVTTDSDHGRKVYPNLTRGMELSGNNQLWVATSPTFVWRLSSCNLAVVIDAFSRRVISWALDRTLEDDLPLQALRASLHRRAPPRPLTPLISSRRTAASLNFGEPSSTHIQGSLLHSM